MNIWPENTAGVGAPTPHPEGEPMDKPIYHHLLIIIDWEIWHNELFLTEEEVESALRSLVTHFKGSLNLSDELAAEILSATDLSELREALEDQHLTVYLSTLTTP